MHAFQPRRPHEGSWPWCGVEVTGNSHYRYSLSAVPGFQEVLSAQARLTKRRERCVGFVRRRVGRGGRYVALGHLIICVVLIGPTSCSLLVPSSLWHCWLGGRKGIRPVKNLSDGLLAWLSVWSEMQTCIWPSWCHCHSLSLASVKSSLFFFLSGTDSPG